MAIVIGKKEEVYGFQTLYREIGYYISRLEQYERALRFFDEAIRKTPNDRRALMGRARARSKACQYAGALDDIRVALNLDPDDLVMLAHKALNTYLDCEFEDGLVQNNRLMPRRKKPDCFVMGAMHCADAIENCLGERAGHPLRDHYKIIRELAWKKNAEAQKPYQPKSKYKKKKKKKQQTDELLKKSAKEPLSPKTKPKTESAIELPPVIEEPPESGEEGEEVPITAKDSCDVHHDEDGSSIRDTVYSKESEKNIIPPFQPFPFRPLQHYTTNIENYMASLYLDILYQDKIFLKNLPNQPGIVCPNKEGTKKILSLAKIGFKTIRYKQELLRARRPFYFIKYQEATSSAALKLRQEMEVRRMQEQAIRDAQSIVSKIKRALDEHKSKVALDLAEKLKVFCDSKSKKILPERQKYLDILYDTVCRAHYDMKRLNKDQYDWDQEKRIYNMLGVPLSREPSTDSVINEFKGVFVDWKKQINVFGERLKKATTADESAWLYHELARFHLELKQYDLARVYARKCVNESKRSGDLRWGVNAVLLIMKVNVTQHNKNDAKTDCIEAIQLAKGIDDDGLKEYLTKTQQVVEKMDFDDIFGEKVLQQREGKIVQMMAGDKMKDEAAHLFRMISAMPAARRMSVMPGIRLTDEETDDKQKAIKRRASIMPGAKPPESSYQTPAAKGKKKDKSEESKGADFMELIQYHVD